MAKVPDSSPIPRSFSTKGLAVFLLYILSISSASASLITVQNLGTTYVDNNTTGGPWVLLGYGANGNLGSPLTAANGTFDAARQGSATLNALAYARLSEKLAISWNQSGKPNGDITSYTHAVAFAFADPSLLTLSAAAQPPAGPNADNWSTDSTDPSTVQISLTTLQGTPNLPSTMYARRETFGARYATAYGFVKSLTGNTQLDWYEDPQAFNALHLGISVNGYVAGGAGGTGNGYVPSTMAIWAKMPLPFELNSTAPLSVSENQPVGTVVGEFNASASNPSFTFEVSAHTSQDSFADTPGAISISFFVNGAWTSNESFFAGANEGEVKSKTFTTAAKPTKLKFAEDGNSDAWGCWKVVFAGTTVLLDPNGVTGSPVGTVPYWVDGDGNGGAPTSQEHVLPTPAYVFSLVDGNGSTGNSLFTLESNGTLKTAAILDYETNASHSIRVRATDEHNASLEGNFTIALLNQVEDLDGDTVEDHYDTDDDGDGFPDSVEIASGSDPRDLNSVPNSAPTALDLNGSSILENQPVGTVIGHLSATDPDANAILSFSLLDGNASGISLDANGTLRALVSLDYETEPHSHVVRIRVTDEHNASLEGNFTIALLNQVEDLDGDGTEDHYDSDDDGDGFPDATEIGYGSDPRDPNSVANAAPTSIELNGTSILENQPVGTVIGHLSATDPDSKAILAFSLVDGNATGISLDANGTLRALVSLDYETEPHSHVVRIRVTDEHNASLEGNFTIDLLDDPSDNPSPENNTTAPVNPDGNQTTVENNATAPVLPESNQTSVENNATVAANADENRTTVDQNATAPAWWEADADSGNGWRSSAWLGSYRPYSNGWIYHLGLGWAYARPDEMGGLWLWMPSEEWVWTVPHCWPHLWKHSSSNWLYFVKEHEGKPALYDYSTESFNWK